MVVFGTCIDESFLNCCEKDLRFLSALCDFSDEKFHSVKGHAFQSFLKGFRLCDLPKELFSRKHFCFLRSCGEENRFPILEDELFVYFFCGIDDSLFNIYVKGLWFSALRVFYVIFFTRGSLLRFSERFHFRKRVF